MCSSIAARVIFVEAAAASLLLRLLLLRARHRRVTAVVAAIHPALAAAGGAFGVGATITIHAEEVAEAGAAAGRLRVGADALEVVEVEEHRRTLGSRFEEVAEVAERVGADHVAVVGGQEPAVGALAGEDVEVVRPEIDHHLLQLPLAVGGAQDSRRL